MNNQRKKLLEEITKDILLSENILDWDFITEKVKRIDNFLLDNDDNFIHLNKDNPLFNYVRLININDKINREIEKAEIELNKYINNFIEVNNL